jgi:CheY-like chemotaxis protein
MANILLVEDDPLVAKTLQSFVELDPDHIIVAIADSLDDALRAVDRYPVDLALVDLQLANVSTGYSVAAALGARGIRCVFVTANAPPWAMPELAIGCLEKPFSGDDVAIALQSGLAPQNDRMAGVTSGGFAHY